MDPDERIRFAIDAIAEVFPDVRSHFEGGTSLVWSEDPWIRGAYTAYHVGQVERFYRAMQQPDGRMYLAGEHASPWPAWIQGAVYSGLGVAQRVNASQYTE